MLVWKRIRLVRAARKAKVVKGLEFVRCRVRHEFAVRRVGVTGVHLLGEDHVLPDADVVEAELLRCESELYDRFRCRQRTVVWHEGRKSHLW
jgi:hypothetical protein